MSNSYMQLIGIGLLFGILEGCGSYAGHGKATGNGVCADDSLAENFWNNFQFSDSSQSAARTEGCFSTYLRLLQRLPYAETEKAEAKLIRTLGLAPAATYRRFMDLAEKYLYDPQSDMCDDELYRPFLKDAVTNRKLDAATRERLQYRLKINSRNRPEHQATDFRFETVDGKRGTLYGINCRYLLVYFNNPDCHDCKVVCDSLKKNPQISRLVSCGMLKILSIYPDIDKEVWRKNAKQIPVSWINACDPKGKIKDNNIYDLKAIPTLYLLDNDKKVILKDPAFKRLIIFIVQHKLSYYY